ncbi:MAG: TGS domain-containing protein [Ignavibacteria bacterium]|nr:TGS domain-containing protein [Ignavibacteria bacterium]
MPANLPPEYFSAEREFKEAKSLEEKIQALEDLISTIPKHKGTDKLRADYRRKLAKLKSTSQAAKKAGKHTSNFHIEREGAARVSVVGMPNTGKSSLLCKLTHATPEVSDSPFTTWAPSPGMMNYENVQIQLIDTPPLNKDYYEPEIFDIIKSSDLILVLIDLLANPIEQFQSSIEILNGNRIYSPHQQNVTEDRKIFWVPILIIVNKDDDAKLDEDFAVLDELLHNEWEIVSISLKNERNLEELKRLIFSHLKIIRVYSKPPHKEFDKTQPFILGEGATIEEFAMQVHKDFYDKLKTARVWGKGVYDGQLVGRDHIIYDGDVVELHI